MPVNDDLGKRMKTYYEQVSKTRLMRRTPVIIRIDGKAFHTFTKGFCRPFDDILIKAMQETTKYLCENIQGCVLGYTQSDEITLVLVDYNKFETQAWFDYEVQKICSIAASMATMAFNKVFAHEVSLGSESEYIGYFDLDYMDTLERAVNRGAMFDARVFNIPKEEVTNCVYWRQLDAMRNSVQMLGQAYFTPKDMNGKPCRAVKDMLVSVCDTSWDELPPFKKWGSCVVKESYNDNFLMKTRWIVDKDIPLFVGEGREYIEKLVYV